MKMEVWKSSDNNVECHIFIPDKGHGYQSGQYVFGYNPRIIKKNTIKKILAIIKEESLAKHAN